MAKALITTVPFGDKCRQPLDALEAAGVEYVINPLGRKLKEEELAEMISDFDVLIAGTESITDRVLSCGSKLKLISRVGIGLDSVDLLSAKERFDFQSRLCQHLKRQPRRSALSDKLESLLRPHWQESQTRDLLKISSFQSGSGLTLWKFWEH